MRRLLGKVVGLLVFFPTELLADPLSNFGQLLPLVAFLACIPRAVLIWSLAYRGATGRQSFAKWRVALIALAVLLLLAVTGFGPANSLFLFAFGLMAFAATSPFLCLWCAIWWWIASRTYRARRISPLAIAVVGIVIMVGLSGAVIWAVFPTECRQMFRL